MLVANRRIGPKQSQSGSSVGPSGVSVEHHLRLSVKSARNGADVVLVIGAAQDLGPQFVRE